MAMTWNESLRVGFGLIDDQHQELFTRYDTLISACKEGKGKDVIRPMLEFLMEYVERHFAEEERCMLRYAYPDREEHLAQHREMVKQINEVYEELKEKGATVGVITSISHSIFNWLLKHVKQTDVLLGRFLAQQAA